MSTDRENTQADKKVKSKARRGFVKNLVYVAPVIVTLGVLPAEARLGSIRP